MLCVAMMLSVMVMGAGAAFTDQDKIVNEEAVDMISALGIVDGYEDDSFQPEKNIERGEAAKMIAVMLNGGKDAVQDTSVSSFNDVLGSADAWANKYIEYGVSKGILAGVGGDRFAPASNVTGTQLAKMLLVSLGYDADKEGYLDDTSWAVNVNTDAASVGLYKGLESIDMNAALTRDNAAQMIWNALNANTVKYFLGSLIENNSTLLETAFGTGYGVDTGILTNIEWNKDRNEYTYTIDGEEYVTAGDYSDLFAMNVAVLRNGNDALLVRVNEGGTVVEGVVGDIGGLDNDHFNTITVNGQKYTLDNVAKDWENFWGITCGYNQYDELFGFRHTDYDQYSFRAIDQDGGGDIDVIVVYPYVVLKTDLVKADSFRTNVIDSNDAYLTVDADEQSDYLMWSLGIRNGSNTVEFDDVQVNGTVAIDGYVMAVPAQYTAQGEDIYTVLDMQNATVTNAADKDSMITLGDTEYNGSMLEPLETFKQISVGKDYGYIEVNGYLFIMDGTGIVPAASNYVVATEVAANTASTNVYGTYETTLLFTDGTTKTVNAKVLSDGQNFYNDPAEKAYVGSMYTYTNDSAGNYLLTRVAPGNAEATTSVFDYQDVYKSASDAIKYGATLDTSTANKGTTGFGISSNDTPYLTSNGTNGTDPSTADQKWTIADDAVIFAYIDRSAASVTNTNNNDVRANEYCVLKGSDLKDLTANDVDWAFIGANTTSQNAPIVEMAYVRLTAHPLDTTMYAYVSSATNRTQVDGDGHYVYVNVLTDATGEVTVLKTPEYLDQQHKMLDTLYNGIQDDSDGIIKVILNKDGDLVGFNGLTNVTKGTVTVYDKGENISIDNVQHTINSDTVIINGGNVADGIQVGETVYYVVDGNGTLDLIVYNN